MPFTLSSRFSFHTLFEAFGAYLCKTTMNKKHFRGWQSDESKQKKEEKERKDVIIVR
jgi:hypothetical protein